MDQLIHAGHLKKFVEQEKTKAEEVEVRPNPTFDWDKDKANNALDEDLPIETIHMIGGPHDPELENRIWGEFCIVK